MYYIGIDLGTSAVKLLLMEDSGKICNIVSKEYPLFFPHPGWSEQKPEDWWEQSKEGIRELVKDVDKSQVAGISFGGQMHVDAGISESICVLMEVEVSCRLMESDCRCCRILPKRSERFLAVSPTTCPLKMLPTVFWITFASFSP